MSLYNNNTTNNPLDEISYQYYDMNPYEMKLNDLNSHQSETSDDSNILPSTPNNINASQKKTKNNPSSNEKGSLTRGPWTKEEDNILFNMVSKLGPEKWVIIAKELGSRNGKQCRERWHNHLDPTIVKSPFTSEEDAKIWELFHSLGPRWALMAKEMPGRPDNSIKNHFNTVLRPRRIFKKKEAESLAAAARQNSESSVILTPPGDSSSEFEKSLSSEATIISNSPKQSIMKRKSTSDATPVKKSYKKICKKPAETTSPQTGSSWSASSSYSFQSHFVDEPQPEYNPLYTYPPTLPHSLSNNFHNSYMPNNLYNPFTLTSLSYQNMNSPIPKVLTMDEPDWDFLQQLGNELGLPLNLN